MNARFKNKVALVTGGASGLGEAIASRLVSDGATVIVADISGEEQAVAARLGSSAVARHLDVSSVESVAELEEWISQTYGGLDILSNNAGIGGVEAPAHEYPVEMFDRVMSINTRGMFLVLQAGLRLMLASGGGAIVNTASIGGFRATPNSIAYIASKGAAVMLTRAAALDYARQGIRVNAVAPGVTRTPLVASMGADMLAMLEEQIPQGQLNEPRDIAAVVAFLADDDENPHVTGQIWTVDGGRSAG